MFENIFVVGYDDDGRTVVVFNDLMNEEQTCKPKRTCLIVCVGKTYLQKRNLLKSQLYLSWLFKIIIIIS